MKKHEKIFRSYKRNHTGSFFQDQEVQKIEKGKLSCDKMLRKADFIPQIGDDDELDKYDELITAVKKLKGSNKNHKDRLRNLKKNDDFM